MNFKDLTQFDLKRTGVEAVWFYAVYVVFANLVTLAIGLIILPFLNFDTVQDEVLSAKLGRSVAIILSSGLALLIVLAKNYHKNILYLILILLSAILASWAGVFLGIVIPAFLTLLPKAERGTIEAKEAASTAPLIDGDTAKTESVKPAQETITTSEKTKETKTEIRGEGYTIIRKEAAQKEDTFSEKKTQPIKYSSAKKESRTTTDDKTEPVSSGTTLPSTNKIEPPMVASDKGTEEIKKQTT